MKVWFPFFLLHLSVSGFAQFSPDQISSDFVLYQRRTAFDKNMRERTINATFAQPLNPETEEKYREALESISQFLLRSPEIEKGLRTLFDNYSNLEYSTQRALLEAVYGTYPAEYAKEISTIVREEKIPKLFAMQTLYLYRIRNDKNNIALLRNLLRLQFPEHAKDTLLHELDHYLVNYENFKQQPVPEIVSLFRYQRQSGLKMIYSFQRWNRDHPGIAVIQNADGNFARDSSGRLLLFQQLARSASDLPYFITNGSTPQGIYSIQGMAVSRNHLIGPTPNVQLVMPNETDSVFWHTPYDSTQTHLANYLHLFPPSWRNYAPITESFYAGKIGRTEIIAHGTTIDPDYFKDKPFYPLTPTMGCLCARENWNIFNGRFIDSDQFKLANAFIATPGDTGYLVVINIDNQQKSVSRDEIEKLVALFTTSAPGQ
jgi:hypothetical protein